MTDAPATTITAALREAAEQLAATSDTARLDAEVLMAHALRMSDDGTTMGTAVGGGAAGGAVG